MARSSHRRPPYVLYGLLALFLILISSLVVFNAMNPTYRYNDNRFESVFAWNTFFEEQAPEEDLYLIYSYLETCGACQQIQQRVLRFAADESNVPLFLADANNPLLRATAQDFRPGTSTVVPTLLVIQGNQLLEEVTGVEGVLNVLEALENGTYTP